MEPRIQYVTTADGVRIACWTLGNGLPLVYLAGGPWSHIELWQLPACRDWHERLARERMLVRYDIRGTGWSQRDVSDYSLDALTLDVEAVVERLGLGPFALMAAADAGPVAISYAARHPEQVSHLVLWCSWARAVDIASPRITAWLRSLDDDWEFTTETCAHLALGWSAGEIGRHAARCLRESVTPETARAALVALHEVDVTPLLPCLATPTLVLHRRDIDWIPVDIARTLASQIPDARLLLQDGESTAPYVGDAEAVVRAIETFLDDGTDRAARREAGLASLHAEDGLPQRTRPYPNGLTAREVEVLRLLAAGATNATIAAELSVSVRTIERHVVNIYGKIDASGRANATAYALTRGLISASDLR